MSHSRSSFARPLAFAAATAALLACGLAAMGTSRNVDTAQPAAPTSATKSATTPAAAPAAKPAAPVLDSERLAFMAGRWVQAEGGNRTEEHWSAPHGDSMIGMFRWCDDAKASMVEMLTVTAELDAEGKPQTVLRLRHFSPALEPWKSEPKALALRYDAAQSKAGDALFVAYEIDGASSAGKLLSVRYSSPEPDRFSIVVSFAAETQREPLVFEMKRE